MDPYLAQATGKLAGITGRDQGGGQPTHWAIPGHMDRRDHGIEWSMISGYMDLY